MVELVGAERGLFLTQRRRGKQRPQRSAVSFPFGLELNVNDPIETVGQKVAAIFSELVAERANRLDGSVIAEPAMSTIESALQEQYGEKAWDVAFHMCDWNSDAAFVVAVHLFPERFTNDEIEAGVGLFLCHAPNHIRAACGLTGQYVWENFPEDDETG